MTPNLSNSSGIWVPDLNPGSGNIEVSYSRMGETIGLN